MPSLVEGTFRIIMRKYIQLSLVGIGILVCLNIFAWQEVFALAGPRYLKVTMLDIGQGDSIFIQTPDLGTILIDGGPDATVLTKLAERLPFWKKSLDVVILTHPDADHLVGLLHVLKKYKVTYVLWTGIVRDGSNYDAWRQLLEDKEKLGTHIVIVDSRTTVKSGAVGITTLNPQENLGGIFFDKQDNDTGIVSHLQYGKTSFLFTADVSSKVEQDLIDSGANLASDVLKVGHHGSKYSTAESFLEAVHPNIAVISVGKGNSYGHPTPEVLQRLDEFGIPYYRTDIHGDVTVMSDGFGTTTSTKRH